MDTLIQEYLRVRVSAWYDPWNTVDNGPVPSGSNGCRKMESKQGDPGSPVGWNRTATATQAGKGFMSNLVRRKPNGQNPGYVFVLLMWKSAPLAVDVWDHK